MELDLLNRAVRTVFDEIPPPIRFGEEDAQAIRKYSRELEAITDELVRGFYDLLYSHPATAAVFKEGERAEREATLRDWWLRTVRGPFDEGYWRWQAFVGVVHFRRGVTNSMMMAMYAWLVGRVGELLSGRLPPQAVSEVSQALLKLAVTGAALTVAGYEALMEEGFAEEAGADPRLVRNIVAMRADQLRRP
ncbi:protoglobin domain-containing protein [Thermocladium modestius]|nr:protoglobin domain-containing protein [Thermocladium modestius]